MIGKIALVIVLIWMVENGTCEVSNDLPRVAATVNGAQISTKDLTVSDYEMEEFILKVQLRKLEGRVRKLIIDQAVERMGISASQVEIDQELNAKFEKCDLEKLLSIVVDKQRRTIDALTKWQVTQDDGWSIYRKDLADCMSEGEWVSWQRRCPTSNEVNRLRETIPRSVDELKAGSRKSIEYDVCYRKLCDRIAGAIVVTEEEIEDGYRKRYSGQPIASDRTTRRSEIAKEIQSRKKDGAIEAWISSEMAKAKIEIRDERLRMMWSDRMKMIAPEVAHPPPPPTSTQDSDMPARDVKK